MNVQTNEGYGALTEREKQTLRLIVRGHDAKSIARSLGLSVHTINERLRDARRKMAVSSSREAARRLFDTEAEGGNANPNSFGDVKIGEAAAAAAVEMDAAPTTGAWRSSRLWITIGGVLMTLMLGLFALMALPQTATAPQNPPATGEVANPAVVDAAKQFLQLVDDGRWADSYAAAGVSFRNLNTLEVWTNVSKKVRPPLGALVSRVFLSQQNVPAPPYSYEMVRFRTSYANKPNAIETVALDREDGVWRVVGVTIE